MKGATTMGRPRKPWRISFQKKPKTPLPDSLKAEVKTKAADLIENVLKPKHVLPPPKDGQFNYLIDIGAKWYRNSFYFFSTYACPGPNALSPRSSRSLHGWNSSATPPSPFISCGTPANGLDCTTHSPWM